MSTQVVSVRAPDGVPLSVRVTGAGQPLVLVHGTTGSRESWALIEPLLAEHFTVWSYDREAHRCDDHQWLFPLGAPVPGTWSFHS